MSSQGARRKPNGHRSTKRSITGARAYGSTPSWGRSAKHWTRAWKAPVLADWGLEAQRDGR